MLRFSNAVVVPLIVEPLRYYFSTYTKTSSNIYWDVDEKKRTLDIGEYFDFNKIPVQEKPRILVTRGMYQIDKVGLTNNLAEAPSIGNSFGKTNNTNFLLYRGSATITIEAKNKGTAELLADMVSHFVAWTRPILCDSQGWKEFGLPMAVSDVAVLSNEDPGIEKFRIDISVPWIKEELWKHTTDGIVLKQILSNVTPQF